MGKCLSKVRTNKNSNNQQQYQIQPVTAALYIAPEHRAEIESLSDTGSSPSIERSPAIADNKNNIGMPDKRSFYSRIPPLSKSISGESRRNLARECSDSKIVTLFQHYKDSTCDAILAEGIVKFCSDLDIKPEDLRILLFAWKCNAETMCKFTKEEFLSGCRAMRTDSIRGLQQKLPDLLMEMDHPEKFKDLYRFTFKFGLDTECGQRILPSDVAMVLWKLVFSIKEPPVLGKWLMFLECHPGIRGIPKDTWFMFLNFIEVVTTDLSNYDDNAAWPSLFDDFVEYENDKLNQNISKDQNLNDL